MELFSKFSKLLNLLEMVIFMEVSLLGSSILELDGARRDLGELNGWNIHMEGCMTCNAYRFMVYHILRQVHLKEVGQSQN